MLSKTAKKKDASDTNKGFIVTESGLVEDKGSSVRHKAKEHKSLLDSVTDSIKETSKNQNTLLESKVRSLFIQHLREEDQGAAADQEGRVAAGEYDQ